MNETMVTVAGRVVADPEHRETRAGLRFTTFRVASTVRRRTKEGVYVDAGTSFYNVAAYRALGANVHTSLRKGDPVLVHGRQQVSTWQRSDGSWGSSVELEASAIGHDLAYATSTCHRAPRGEATSSPGEPGDDVAETGGVPDRTIEGPLPGAQPTDVTDDPSAVPADGSGQAQPI